MTTGGCSYKPRIRLRPYQNRTAPWIFLSLFSCFLLPSLSAPDDLDDLEKLWSIADKEFQPIKRRLEEPAFRHDKSIILDASSAEAGWIINRQCHRNFPLFPALQISFPHGAVRNMKITRASNVEKAWIEGSSVQLLETTPDTELCLHNELRNFVKESDGNYVLTVGPYFLRLFDGFFPLDVEFSISYPEDHFILSRIEPSGLEGVKIELSPGLIHFHSLFEGQLEMRFYFKVSANQ